MKHLTVQETDIGYDAEDDILFASFGDYDPTMIDYEVDAGNGIFLMYAYPSDELACMEIYHFVQHFGGLPTVVTVNLPEPISISLPTLEQRTFTA